MRNFRKWLRWIIKGRHATGQLNARLTVLEARDRDRNDIAHLIEPAIDSKFSAMNADVQEQLKEIRERLEMGQKRKSSGRPFSVLRKVAEMGEAAKRDTVA